MKRFFAVLVILFAISACSKQAQREVLGDTAPTADVGAGRAVAEKNCRACHGMDGKATAPGIPHLSGQRERYMLAALKEYSQGMRAHATLRDLIAQLGESDVRNAVAYYATLPATASATGGPMRNPTPYEQGKKTAAACANCHGFDGNANIRGTPSLAGQQPHYLVSAFQRHHPRKGRLGSVERDSDPLLLENLALYYASQKPIQRSSPPQAASAAGEPLAAKCAGCHGSRGVTNDAATPNLAGQDFHYLANAIRSYRASRREWGMHRYVTGLGNNEVAAIAAYYAAQQPKAAERVPGSTQQLAEKCDGCHDQERGNGLPAPAPKLRSQDKDYLVMALRAYRDGSRESSPMHNLSFAYSNTIIESLASWYASQPGN